MRSFPMVRFVTPLPCMVGNLRSLLRLSRPNSILMFDNLML